MARDPQTRPFRAAAMGIFIAFAALFIALIIRGILLSLVNQGALPVRASSAGCRRTVESCGDALRALRAALDQESGALERTGTQAERRWDDWAVGWQRELASLQVDCCVTIGPVPTERAPLARATEDVERLERLYATHLVQYAREIGPQSERCASDLAVIPSVDRGPTSSPPNP